jgi:hypothetical protein
MAMKSWKARLVALAAIAAAGLLAPSLTRANVKIGLDEVTLGGAKYTHDNGTKYTSSKDLVGTQLAVEYLPTEFFGIEVDYGLTPLTRTYQLGPNGSVSNNVTENAAFFLYGVNLYFGRDDRRGFHPELGVSTGSATVSQKFEGGTLGAKSTNNTVSLNVLKAGVDWMTSYAGVRLQYQVWTGEKSNSTLLAGVRQTVSYTGSAAVIGVFANF